MLFLFICPLYDFLSLAKLDPSSELAQRFPMCHTNSFLLPESFPVPLSSACPHSLSVSKMTAMELKVKERNPKSQIVCMHLYLWVCARTRLLQCYMN